MPAHEKGPTMAFEFDKLASIISETLGCAPDKVVRDAQLDSDLGADSLAAMELVMAVEEAFDIEISDTQLDKFKTVADLAEYVEAQL